jgi:hypothetical protein
MGQRNHHIKNWPGAGCKFIRKSKPNFQPSSTNTPLVNPGFQPTQQSLLSIKLLVFLVVTCMQMEKLSCYWITATPPKN